MQNNKNTIYIYIYIYIKHKKIKLIKKKKKVKLKNYKDLNISEYLNKKKILYKNSNFLLYHFFDLLLLIKKENK